VRSALSAPVCMERRRHMKEREAGQRRPYETPTLVVLGTLAELTQGAGGPSLADELGISV
jgi:hypothetical protein